MQCTPAARGHTNNRKGTGLRWATLRIPPRRQHYFDAFAAISVAFKCGTGTPACALLASSTFRRNHAYAGAFTSMTTQCAPPLLRSAHSPPPHLLPCQLRLKLFLMKALA